MKPVNWDSDRVRNRVDHDTPFMVLDVQGDRQIRLYGTPCGAYGPQVMALLYGGDDVLVTTTGGCGYDKMHAALERCFSELGRAPRGFKWHDQRLYAFHVGGNYYRVPVKDWTVWK